jgi:geranylgeranyl pyrophosphate synthase
MKKNQTITLKTFIKNSREDIENKIETTIPNKNIVTILKGGKRLRSVLSNLAFKTCTKGNETNKEYQGSLINTVLIELAHTASLVHDDMIDRDKERRGIPCIYIKRGFANALLTGHKMLAIGFEICLLHGQELARVFMDAYDEVVKGEFREVDFNKNDHYKSISVKESTKSKYFSEYNSIINMKTASLFSNACKAGAIQANMTGDIVKVFSDYGREIGLAYQLADDLVDLVKGETIDSVIVPLLNRLENKPSTRFLTKRKIRKKLKIYYLKIKQLYINEIYLHIGNAVELTKSKEIPKSLYKELLEEAPEYIINQMLREIDLAL